MSEKLVAEAGTATQQQIPRRQAVVCDLCPSPRSQICHGLRNLPRSLLAPGCTAPRLARSSKPGPGLSPEHRAAGGVESSPWCPEEGCSVMGWSNHTSRDLSAMFSSPRTRHSSLFRRHFPFVGGICVVICLQDHKDNKSSSGARPRPLWQTSKATCPSRVLPTPLRNVFSLGLCTDPDRERCCFPGK